MNYIQYYPILFAFFILLWIIQKCSTCSTKKYNFLSWILINSFKYIYIYSITSLYSINLQKLNIKSFLTSLIIKFKLKTSVFWQYQLWNMFECLYLDWALIYYSILTHITIVLLYKLIPKFKIIQDKIDK